MLDAAYDWVIMVRSKHQLRKVIKLTHKILSALKLKMHPDKTFIGCIKKGFDFLGVRNEAETSLMSEGNLPRSRQPYTAPCITCLEPSSIEGGNISRLNENSSAGQGLWGS
jgi:hypothetical protein